jgi:hypothetical protein
MKKILTILLIFTLSFFCFNQELKDHNSIIREYFFEGIDLVENGQELVVIVKSPQSKFAREFGHKLYSDTTFLNQIKRDFYVEKKIGEEDILFFCGFDMFFYVKSGNNLKFFKQINSSCNVGNLTRRNLETLNQNGVNLNCDTMKLADLKRKNTGKNKLRYKFDNLIYSTSVEDNIWQNNVLDEEYVDFYNSCHLPFHYYDSYFETEIPIDTSFSLKRNIEQYLIRYGIDSLEFKNINYRIQNEHDIGFSYFFSKALRNSKPLKVSIYFNYEYLENFKDFTLVNLKEKYKKSKRKKLSKDAQENLSKFGILYIYI